MKVEDRRFLKATEVAAVLGCSRIHVYDLARENKIPSYRVGGMVRFDKEQFSRWLEAGRVR